MISGVWTMARVLSPIPRPWLFFAAVWAYFSIAGTAQALVQLAGLSFTPRSGVDIRMTGYYDNLPKAGTAPLRITIRNDSAKARTWTFRFKSQSGYSSDNHYLYIWFTSVAAGTE